MGLISQTQELYYEGADGNWNSGDENYGNYQFISIKDVINNFMIAYVGEDASHTVGPETEIIEANGRYLIPGFCDAHMHVESGMVTVTGSISRCCRRRCSSSPSCSAARPR